MSECNGRLTVKKHFLFFSWSQKQPHEFSQTLRHSVGGWWQIHEYCKHCDIHIQSGMLDDEEVVQILKLKKVPQKKGGFSVYFSDTFTWEELEPFRLKSTSNE